ncbi:MAG: glutaminase A [Synechococcus sp.]
MESDCAQPSDTWTLHPASAPNLDTYLASKYNAYLPISDGTVANYIPELAKVDPNQFGISLVSTDGNTFDVGDCQQQFTIQSISKAFVYGLALETRGRDRVWARVGVEPSGEAFNSIVLDRVTNRPFNPMVNAGAIATTDLIPGNGSTERLTRVLDMFERYTGRKMYIDVPVSLSERATGSRNRAIAYLMHNFGMIGDKIDESLDLYFQQCSILVTAHDLALMAATLANGGINPITGVCALRCEYVQDVLSVMHTCGMYNYSGEWAYRVGIPAKSGVGGGITAVVPQKLGIGVFSPALDERGNSVRGVRFCQDFSQDFGLHLYCAANDKQKLDEWLRSGHKPTNTETAQV